MTLLPEGGPRLAGGRAAMRGRLARRLRGLQAERGLNDADLLRAGGSSDKANLSGYLTGARFPDPRCFVQLVDSFRNAGAGLFLLEQIEVQFLYFEEAPAWDRFTSGRTEWVSETHLVPPTRASRATQASPQREETEHEQ